MKLKEFKIKLIELGYYSSVYGSELVIRDDTETDWYDYWVARIALNEEHCVYFDYCVPFSKQLYMLIYDFIRTPLALR